MHASKLWYFDGIFTNNLLCRCMSAFFIRNAERVLFCRTSVANNLPDFLIKNVTVGVVCHKRHCFVSVLFSETVENFYSFLLLITSMLEVNYNTLYQFLHCYYFCLSHQHKAAGMKIRLSKNHDHDGVSHGVKCSQEGERIPPLKSDR